MHGKTDELPADADETNETNDSYRISLFEHPVATGMANRAISRDASDLRIEDETHFLTGRITSPYPSQPAWKTSGTSISVPITIR